MPIEASWEERSLSPKRVLREWTKVRSIVIRRLFREHQPARQVAEYLGVSRAFVYKWRKRWLEGGRTDEALRSRSCRPHRTRDKRTPFRDGVRELRVQFRRWSARKIQRYLRLPISHQTVHEILVEEDLVTVGPKKRRVYRSWARKHGNSLWQTDLKQLTHDPSGPWLITFMDDASRFVLASKITGTTPRTVDVLHVLEGAIRQWGTPRQILSDHGVQYHSMQGKGEFTKRLEELGILHIKAGIRKPTTTGKIERWHRTLIDEFLVDCEDFGDVVECLPNFLEVYNTIRPHEALDYEVPLVRYLGSLIREESI